MPGVRRPAGSCGRGVYLTIEKSGRDGCLGGTHHAIPSHEGVHCKLFGRYSVLRRHLVNIRSPSLNLGVSRSVFGGYCLPRSRLTRSELKAQDEITTTLQSVGEMAVARKNELLAGLAIVVVLVFAFLGWRYYSTNRDAGAQGELGAAIATFRNPAIKSDKERFEKTIVEAQKALADYPSARTAPIARYYLALAQDGLGDMPNAVKNLEEVISRADADTKPIAQFALAGIYKRHGDFQKGMDVLKQLESSGGYSKSAVHYELGASAEAANQKDQAQTYYSKVITESPDSPFRGDAEAALKRMGLPLPPPAPVPAPAPKAK